MAVRFELVVVVVIVVVVVNSKLCVSCGPSSNSGIFVNVTLSGSAGFACAFGMGVE